MCSVTTRNPLSPADSPCAYRPVLDAPLPFCAPPQPAPPLSAPVPAPPPAPARRRKHPARWAIIAAITALLTAAALAALGLRQPPSPQPQPLPPVVKPGLTQAIPSAPHIQAW